MPLLDADLDPLIKQVVESQFPVDLIIDRENNRGLIRFNEKFPPFAGLLLHVIKIYHDLDKSHLGVQYRVLESPNGVHPRDIGVQMMMNRILSTILQVEDHILLERNLI